MRGSSSMKNFLSNQELRTRLLIEIKKKEKREDNNGNN